MIILFFFITGPSLPYGLWHSAMAESPDGRGVILFGGRSYENLLGNRILELHAGASANTWNILNVTLKNARASQVVILLS